MGARLLARRAAFVVPAAVVWTSLCLTVYEVGTDPGHGHHHAGPAVTGTALSMWLVMLAAMMVPTVLPWVAAIARRGRMAGALAFLSGYTAVWLLFAVGATTLQALLSAALSAGLGLEDGAMRGAALMLVGAYQWTPLKRSCLKHCESPVAFFLSHWRDGVRGAALMGVQHGTYCVGCCWLLMLSMLALGAMDVLSMAGFTLFALAEMYVPEWRPLSRAAGAVLVATGLYIL